jgi:hypothetical protein|tara:strand:+ start:1655 stop:1777 length:123 start_codon:yes stop_codon:yes gene_type:complete
MPVPLRKFYGRKLVEAKKKEADSYKKSQDSQIARPAFQKS